MNNIRKMGLNMPATKLKNKQRRVPFECMRNNMAFVCGEQMSFKIFHRRLCEKNEKDFSR